MTAKPELHSRWGGRDMGGRTTRPRLETKAGRQRPAAAARRGCAAAEAHKRRAPAQRAPDACMLPRWQSSGRHRLHIASTGMSTTSPPSSRHRRKGIKRKNTAHKPGSTRRTTTPFASTRAGQVAIANKSSGHMHGAHACPQARSAPAAPLPRTRSLARRSPLPPPPPPWRCRRARLAISACANSLARSPLSRSLLTAVAARRPDRHPHGHTRCIHTGTTRALLRHQTT